MVPEPPLSSYVPGFFHGVRPTMESAIVVSRKIVEMYKPAFIHESILYKEPCSISYKIFSKKTTPGPSGINSNVPFLGIV